LVRRKFLKNNLFDLVNLIGEISFIEIPNSSIQFYNSRYRGKKAAILGIVGSIFLSEFSVGILELKTWK
jgi:hypothetical protein